MHSGYGEGIGVAAMVAADFKVALIMSVDFHPVYVATNTLLS